MFCAESDGVCSCGAPATTVTPDGPVCDDCARALASHLYREGGE
jgi:hypothetical protein